MKITSIYEKYGLMDSLCTHMLNVAGLTCYLLEKLDLRSEDDLTYIKGALLHDIGKMVSFKIGLIPGSLAGHTHDYWTAKQNNLKKQYGIDPETATKNILDELNVNEDVRHVATTIGFIFGKRVLDSGNMQHMVACYSDQRISPFGIAPLTYRMQEGRIHFRANNNIIDEGNEELVKWEKYSNAFILMEKLLFAKSTLNPDHITDKDLVYYIELVAELEL